MASHEVIGTTTLAGILHNPERSLTLKLGHNTRHKVVSTSTLSLERWRRRPPFAALRLPGGPNLCLSQLKTWTGLGFYSFFFFISTSSTSSPALSSLLPCALISDRGWFLQQSGTWSSARGGRHISAIQKYIMQILQKIPLEYVYFWEICLPCLLYFIRCSGVHRNPAHVEVHSIWGECQTKSSKSDIKPLM